MVILVAILVLASIAVLIYGSYNVNSGFYIKTKSKSKTFNRSILLTFDDGPDVINTPGILDILEKNNIKAVFFVTGMRAQSNPELLKKIFSKGHLIGNHSFTHSIFFPIYSKKRMITDLIKAANIVENIIGCRIIYFRPPFGVTNPTIAFAVKKLGYKAVGWSVRSLDTVLKKKEKIFSSVIKKVKGGEVILFHDTVKGTAEMLEDFIAYCKGQGLEFCDPDKFFAED